MAGGPAKEGVKLVMALVAMTEEMGSDFENIDQQ